MVRGLGKLYNFDGECYGLEEMGLRGRRTTTDGAWGSYTILMVSAMDCGGNGEG